MMDDSLFISDAVHEREVELPDGQKHTLFFRELPASKFRSFQEAERSKDESVREGSIARLIAASVCEPDGKPSMTFERAMKLKPAAAGAILERVLEINGFGEKKASTPATDAGSGTS